MGKKVSARIKNRVKAHFVRSLMLLERKLGGREHAPSKKRTTKKTSKEN